MEKTQINYRKSDQLNFLQTCQEIDQLDGIGINEREYRKLVKETYKACRYICDLETCLTNLNILTDSNQIYLNQLRNDIVNLWESFTKAN